MDTLIDSPLISVVIPIHSRKHSLDQIRKVLHSTNKPIQIILVVNNPDLNDQIIPQKSNELVLISSRKGRGFAFLKGIECVTGNITMLLHSDTIPPRGWDQAIISALEDPQVVGGGFSLSYDTPNPYLEVISWVGNQWSRISGVLYGDRALFVRSHILRRCLSFLEVPLFEDLRLARCMRKHGRVVILKEKVETSAEKYRKHGYIQYIGRIWFCQTWYTLGGSPFQIYNFYYSDRK